MIKFHSRNECIHDTLALKINCAILALNKLTKSKTIMYIGKLIRSIFAK